MTTSHTEVDQLHADAVQSSRASLQHTLVARKERQTFFCDTHQGKFTEQLSLEQRQNPMGCSFHHWGHRSESFTLLYNMITLLAFTRLTQGTWVQPSSGSSAEKTAPGTWEHPFFSASPDPDHNGVVVSPCSGLGRLWAGGRAGRDEALSHSSVLELVFQTSMVWCGATCPNPRDILQSCTPALVWVHNSSHDLAQLHTNQSFFLSGGSPAFTKLLLVPCYLVV